jgi:hypothetical protein
MDWFKKHADTVVVLGGILASVLWMNGKFAAIEKEITIMKTVLIMKDIMPKELATHSLEKGDKSS